MVVQVALVFHDGEVALSFSNNWVLEFLLEIKKYNQIWNIRNKPMCIYSCLWNRKTPSTGLQLFLHLLDLFNLLRFGDFDEFLLMKTKLFTQNIYSKTLDLKMKWLKLKIKLVLRMFNFFQPFLRLAPVIRFVSMKRFASIG